MQHIRTISHVGASDHGMAVDFHLQLTDGSIVQYSMPHELLSMALQGLRTAGQLAEQMRRGVAPAETDLTYSNQANAVRTARIGNEILVRFGTSQGLPVQLTMTDDLAHLTIERLHAALRIAPEPERPMN